MTQDQQQRPGFDLVELGQKWGRIVNSLLAEIVTLEKEKGLLAERINQLLQHIAGLEENEAVLLAKIESLREARSADGEPPPDEQSTLSEEAAAIARRPVTRWDDEEA